MIRKLLLSAAGALSLIAAAQAADMPKSPVYKAAPAPVFDWSGWYAGFDVGGMWSEADVPITGVAVVSRPDPEGWLGGIHLGYRWQAPSSRWVYGIEADIWGGDIEGGFVPVAANEIQLELKWGGSIRGVVGVAINPPTLLYFTGGAAVIRAEGCVALVANGPCAAGNYSDTRWGWTVGAGIAHAFSPRWIVRLEYLYADFGDKTYDTPGVGAGETTLDLQTHTVRAGLSYRFSTR